LDYPTVPTWAISLSLFKTTDLYDHYLEDLQVAAPVFRDFGGRRCFYGRIVTLKALEDNTYLKAAFETDGKGKVLVVDSAASLRCAMMGDAMAALGAAHGWQGVIINGCIRDCVDVAKVNIGVKALATIPRKTTKRNQGVIEYSGRSRHPIPVERDTPFRLKSTPDSGERDTPYEGFKM